MTEVGSERRIETRSVSHTTSESTIGHLMSLIGCPTNSPMVFRTYNGSCILRELSRIKKRGNEGDGKQELRVRVEGPVTSSVS